MTLRSNEFQKQQFFILQHEKGIKLKNSFHHIENHNHFLSFIFLFLPVFALTITFYLEAYLLDVKRETWIVWKNAGIFRISALNVLWKLLHFVSITKACL
jgi:hypothetical protein